MQYCDQQLWFTAARTLEIREQLQQVPDTCNMHESAGARLLVAARASTISRGTELLLYAGEVAAGFDNGDAATLYPRRYGYSWVGDVVAGSCATLPIGTRVFSLLPHGSHHWVDPAQLRAISAAIPAARATLAANLETAITAVWDTPIAFGSSVLVLGAGVVGSLIAWLAAKAGARVVLCDPQPARLACAQLLGGFTVRATPPAGQKFDCVLEATGDPRALNLALTHAGRESQITVVSAYGTRSAAIELGERFHRERQSLRSSQVSTIPSALAPRWDFARRFDLVCQLLEEPALDHLVVHRAAFASAAQAYAELAHSHEKLTITLEYAP